MISWGCRMDEKQKQMAKAAQKINKGWTIDDLFEAVLESTRKTGFGMVRALNGYIEMQSYDMEQICKDYADAMGKDELTSADKSLALLNHVLEQGTNEEA